VRDAIGQIVPGADRSFFSPRLILFRMVVFLVCALPQNFSI